MIEDINPGKKTWRFIVSPQGRGGWNMAVDEAIMMSIGERSAKTTLRLYSWEPPCLSIGYAQSSEDVDIQQLNALGWDLVRRPTGGKAILHTDELTYSIIGKETDHFLHGGVLQSYQRLAAGLLGGVASLGVQADVNESLPFTRSGTRSQDPVCFDVPSKYEITIQGKKLIGSAQSRKQNAVLQHGTLPLHGDITRIVSILKFPNKLARKDAAANLLNRATTIESVIGKKTNWMTAAKLFSQGFSNSLGIELDRCDLTPNEYERAKGLCKQKYSRQSWIERI